jgi:nicotinate-nucleotide pyrophosphorylase (carboxylating)
MRFVPYQHPTNLPHVTALVKGRIDLEATGNVNLQTIRAIAETSVDYISVGLLTKNIQAVDLSMRVLFQEQ